MKKILISLCAILITTSMANADQINYNAAGGITSTTRTTPYGFEVNNYPTGTMSGFGSNALFAPATSHRISQEQRRIKNEQTYLENTKNINVNINHTGINPYGYNNRYRYNNYYPSNYNNGIRYYNNNGYNGINNRGLRIF